MHFRTSTPPWWYHYAKDNTSKVRSNPNHPPGPYHAGQHVVPPARAPSPATASYRLNHLMLRIKNPEESCRFYNDCFGLHVVFIFNAGPWTIYYLGPRDVSISTIGTSKGLLELYHIPGDASLSYTSGNDYASPGVGFGHIGFTVPDVAAVIERVKGFGYEVIKPLGEASEDAMGVPVDAAGKVKGDGSGGVVQVDEGYKHVFRQLAFVRDPDGYWVELVPQVVKAPGHD
ncbi:Glyoxalase/Bleomycin resistance protein/Dihydroxybiphenyl dioxygenase [Massarina eburnea CBS 473.64]|uniref:Glyoxalase/Bleomycin resistance protein/Dihydroxybiphenyl dioxygenase n=1 Tax=Massarina eburnea CBS 473.64 TaxID=1395130 RepID=A0A6A6S602_9PLEO|nr:Glyoxalase/Bleomycin resistance protein/Dihydroxybiphenyl dioxygenase [Massarina eburnea CBS 473.64]